MEAEKKPKKILRKPLSQIEIGRILEARDSGESINDIAIRVGRSKSGVHGLIQRYEATGATTRRPSTGRKRKTTTFEDEQIAKEVLYNRAITSRQIADNLGLHDLSADTIERRIHEQLGFSSCFKIKKNFISEANRVKRLEWAEAHKDWTIEQWRRIIWSDESPFVLRYSGRVRVWRLSNERYEPYATKGTVKHDKKINVWGCFSGRGVGKIRRVEGILKSDQMRDILAETLLPTIQLQFPNAANGDNYIFQQDNDPKHTSNLVQTWLAANNVPLLPWPSQSPDLNPIENLWSILDRKLQLRTPQNENDLFLFLESGWNALETGLLQKLVDSMPHRCAAVIKNRGYCTKY